MAAATPPDGYSEMTVKTLVDGAKSGQPGTIEKLKQAAAVGESNAQVALGMLYAGAGGVPKDLSEALKWWKKASELGNSQGGFLAGAAYNNGEGVSRDMGKAIEYWRKSARLGNVSAMGRAGIALGDYPYEVDHEWYSPQRESAMEGAARLNEALYWLRQAGEHGDPCAYYVVAWFYDIGKGVKLDHKAAIDWLLKAADLGCTASQSRLGYVYRSGKHVPRDRIAAYKWWTIALPEMKDLQKQLDELSKAMSAEEIAAARKLSKDWKTQHPANPAR